MTNDDSDWGPPGTVLMVAPDVVLRLRGGGDVEVVLGGRRHFAGTRILGILERFCRPLSVATFFQDVAASGLDDFIEATSLLARLREEGVLVEPNNAIAREANGFDAPSEYVAMLDDITRTTALVRAVHEVVRPGDVVLEIGTGTGVLAVEAARAGARLVFAVEERGIAEVAQVVFVANGVADRVQLVRGPSNTIVLPEKADVLVSEVLGNDPFAENIIGVFRDARRRLLKPGARLIPQTVDVMALAVDLPDAFLGAHTFTKKNVDRWQNALGVNVQPLAAFRSRVVNLASVLPQQARHWKVVADPVRLASIDLGKADEAPSSTTSFLVRDASRSLGLILYFEAKISPSIVISTSPAAAADDNHWRCRVFRATDRPVVNPGDTVRVEFSATSGSSTVRA